MVSIISFADGTSATADVVVGADGLKSVVRGAVTRADPSQSVTWSQTYVYRTVVPTEDAKAAGVKRVIPSDFGTPGDKGIRVAHDMVRLQSPVRTSWSACRYAS